MTLSKQPQQTCNLRRQVTGDGPDDAPIVVITDVPSWDDPSAKRLLADYAGRMLFNQFRNAGISRMQIRVESICECIPPNRHFFLLPQHEQTAWKADALARLSRLRPNVFVPLGDLALNLITGLNSCDKWHLSILSSVPALGEKKVIPLLHPERILRSFRDLPWLTLGAQRISEESRFPELRLPQRTLRTFPLADEVIGYCGAAEEKLRIGVDIETGYGQITCVGIAISPTDALCIPTLPGDWDANTFHRVWSAIASLMRSRVSKVFQNGIYDTTYFSRYGIRVNAFWHDTMIAQKFLYPEFAMGLDTIARLWTREPYWKDDAKDWGARQDKEALYRYNAKDAAVTLEAAMSQRLELQSAGTENRFQDYLMRLTQPVAEASWRGLPLDVAERERLRAVTESRVEELEKVLQAESQEVLGEETNPRSPLQVKRLLKACGFRVPQKKGKESSDKEALLKLRVKNPGSKLLTALIDLSEEQKKISSYLKFAYDAEPEARVRYSLLAHGTETGRLACHKDPFDRGLNAQTFPAELRSMIALPPGRLLVEVDLKQADGRFVAWDANEKTLIGMYRDGVDIHRWVASQPELFNKAIDTITKDERQLGKKTGHAANYGIQGKTLALNCLKDMGLVLDEGRATRMLEGYHRALSGIRVWQKRIEDEVTRTKKLTTPFGRSRVFYDRLGPELFKEAYAYRPQSTVSDVINQLWLWVFGKTYCLLQVHDSLLMETTDAGKDALLALIRDQDAWNPLLSLRGGELRIPIEIKMGRSWGAMEEVKV